ncbi:MAG: LysR family transcriptional regulator [Massilia sp.]
MELNQLRIFTAIAREGSIARAAERVFLSQPAVSAQLKALEEQLGLKLFERQPRGMDLTGAGRHMLIEADKLLKAADALLNESRRLRGAELSGEFKLGTISDPVMLRLGLLFSLMLPAFPGLKPVLRQGISGHIVERVAKGELHAGYVIGAPSDPRVTALRVAPVTLRIVAPAAWRAQVMQADWDAMARLPWIATSEQCSFRQIAARMMARHGVTPRSVVEMDEESALIDLVRQGIGLTLLREDVALRAEVAGELCIWPPGTEIDGLYFVHPAGGAHAQLCGALLPLIRQVWQLPPDATASEPAS